jgi:hypothetical protein
MKTTILPTFSSSFTRAMTALLLLTCACDHGAQDPRVDREGVVECSPEGECEPTEAQTLAHSKEIVVSDGHNEVTLLVASEDPGLIERYGDETFEIVPVFERPELSESDEGNDDDEETPDPDHDFSESVLIEEGSVSLEEGAIGYQLREVGSEFRNAISCKNRNVYTSKMDYASLSVTSDPCTEARISTERWAISPYIERGHKPEQCSNMVPFSAGKKDTNRVKLEVCPKPTHEMTFYN